MTTKSALLVLLFGTLGWSAAEAQTLPSRSLFLDPRADSSVPSTPAAQTASAEQSLKSLWGMDILFSTGGFGLGVFYRKEFSPDIAGVVSFSVSESKDEREVEQIDPFTQTTYVPGKLNRFLVLPLTFGIQYRLFRDEIVDTFRPFLNAGVGPAMIYMMPFVRLSQGSDGSLQTEQVEFFSAIGDGQAHYTATAYLGFGANFGTEKMGMLGVNFKYYFTYLFSNGLPSVYNPANGAVTSNKTDFGGFVITLNVGIG